jgi:hypothetical protein
MYLGCTLSVGRMHVGHRRAEWQPERIHCGADLLGGWQLNPQPLRSFNGLAQVRPLTSEEQKQLQIEQ